VGNGSKKAGIKKIYYFCLRLTPKDLGKGERGGRGQGSQKKIRREGKSPKALLYARICRGGSDTQKKEEMFEDFSTPKQSGVTGWGTHKKQRRLDRHTTPLVAEGGVTAWGAN